MTDKKYIDLLITEGDFMLNSGNEPTLCHNRISIGQDTKHAIIESGLVNELIAERSPVLRADIMMRMELLIESDDRLIPGTVNITDDGKGNYHIDVDTYDFGPLLIGETI